MNPLIWLTLKAFLACLVLTPIFRDIFRSYGVVDRPDRKRKVHVYPIPRVGGIPIAIAYAIALIPFGEKTLLDQYGPIAWKLAPAALLVFATGLIDDLLGLKPWQKLAGQVGASALAYWAGVRVLGVAGQDDFHQIWWSLPLTVLWLLVCANAFNLVDGLDGLAAGMGLVSALTITAAALLNGNTPLAYVCVPLVGALVGFLCYNFNPATVFLGDSGSLLIGFLLGCYCAIWSQKSAALVGITVPLLALFIPMMDVALAILRRFLRNQPIFSADRGHIHHRLLDRGLTPRRAVLVLYMLCAMAAAFALLLTMPHLGRYYGVIIFAACAVALYGVRELRYAEFGIASRLLFGGELQRTLGGRLRLEKFGADLAQAQTEEQSWLVLASAARDFGFSSVQLLLRGRIWEQAFLPADGQDCLSVSVPLGEAGSVHLTRPFECGVLPMMVSAFLDTVRRSFQTKLQDSSQHTVA